MPPQSTHGTPLRFWLGMGQMFGAAVALVLLLMTGVGWTTMTAAAVATALSAASRLLFREKR